MPSLGRSIVAVLLGLVVAVVVIMTIEMINSQIYRPPPGFDFADPAAMRTYVQQLPLTALLIVVLGWALGALMGGWMAAKRAPRAPLAHAMIVALGLVAATVMNLTSLPHPTWMWALGPLGQTVGAFAGARLAVGGPQAQTA
jgi:hypothetical protein